MTAVNPARMVYAATVRFKWTSSRAVRRISLAKKPALNYTFGGFVGGGSPVDLRCVCASTKSGHEVSIMS
jgi:hypothetical protein